MKASTGSGRNSAVTFKESVNEPVARIISSGRCNSMMARSPARLPSLPIFCASAIAASLGSGVPWTTLVSLSVASSALPSGAAQTDVISSTAIVTAASNSRSIRKLFFWPTRWPFMMRVGHMPCGWRAAQGARHFVLRAKTLGILGKHIACLSLSRRRAADDRGLAPACIRSATVARRTRMLPAKYAVRHTLTWGRPEAGVR